MSEYREIVIISAIATALLLGSVVAGIVYGHPGIAGFLAALALCFVLLVGWLSLLGSDEEQRRAQGLQLAQASSSGKAQGCHPEKPSRFSRAKEFCLPMARVHGLALCILFGVTAFALLGKSLVDALVDAGLANWFLYKHEHEEVHPLLQWFWLSLSQALRALDILDMIEAGAGDLHIKEVRDAFAPIEGEKKGLAGQFGGALIVAFRIAIGVLLVTQAVNAISRRRRMTQAVKALAEPEICENAKRILKVSGRIAIGPLIKAWKRRERPDDRQWQRYDLRLMSTPSARGLTREGRSLVVVAFVKTEMHIRIFDASGEKVVDKKESKLVGREVRDALKQQLTPLPDEASLSRQDRQVIIDRVRLIAGHTQWRLQALEVCCDLGTKASRLEPRVQSLLEGDRAARADTEDDDGLLQSAVRCLAAISDTPEEIVESICVLWERALELDETRRLSWKGALGLAVTQCIDRIKVYEEKREDVIASIGSRYDSDLSAWLVWQLQAPNREPPRWPLIIMREDASAPDIVTPAEMDRMSPEDIRHEPLEDELDDIRDTFNDTLDRYAEKTNLNGSLELSLPGTEPLTFSLVPAGAYWRGNLGDKGDGDTNERPQHPVILRYPFYLQDSSVTIGQFERFIEHIGREELGDELSGLWDDLRRRDAAERHPMPYVSWTNARKFCDWLMREHFEKARQALGGAFNGGVVATLPSECEWEWAARGPAVWTYPWGNEIDSSRLQFFEKPFDVEVPGTAEMRSFESGRSWCGLYDMAGNLFTWCDDQLQDYQNFSPGAFANDPIGVTANPERVQKGGAWCFTDWDARSSYRYPIDDEDLEDYDCGMRIALVVGRPRAL